MDDAERAALEAAVGYHFRQPEMLAQALTHSSHRQEMEGARAAQDNERLEFLGDAVLSLLVSEYLIARFPEWKEGQLSKCRARLVSERSLHAAARRLDLGRHLQLGRGEEKTGGREKQAVLADAYEALAAAVYLDGGIEPAAKFARRSLLDVALGEEPSLLGESDHKSALQEWLQARHIPPAEYRVVHEKGPDHRKTFDVEVHVRGRALAAGQGRNKKEAEQAAARAALEHLRSPQEAQHE